MPSIPEPGKQRQVDVYEFEVSLIYITSKGCRETLSHNQFEILSRIKRTSILDKLSYKSPRSGSRVNHVKADGIADR